MDKIKVLLLSLIALSLLVSGWFANDTYRYYSNKRDINGFWTTGNYTRDGALNYAESRDTIGSWVCINIKGMTIKEIIDTCSHEAGHEIFAQKCTNDPLDCLSKVGVENGS